MISFPHAKINLGLSIVSKRPDGFHNLETIFYPILLRDVLEITPSVKTKLIVTGLTVPGESQNNLVMKTYEKIKNSFPQAGALEINLHKCIPMGAGLGGGSSDAAGMLHMMNQLFHLQIPAEKLLIIASELGSDCPFFMQDLPCYATGRGEILEPVTLDLSAYSLLLIHPEIKIDTAWAFSKITPNESGCRLMEMITQPISCWQKTIHNDFEIPVFNAFPSLQKIKDKLYAAGALYASMTGSGSTIFGIFEKGKLPEMDLERAGQTFIG